MRRVGPAAGCTGHGTGDCRHGTPRPCPGGDWVRRPVRAPVRVRRGGCGDLRARPGRLRPCQHGVPGSWPYPLWGALDGAAGLCAVLLMRRAARGESAVAPRLAVWGLVAASSLFNWAHAPDHPGARRAFALMPVIAATLFEFSLRETRHTAQHAERILPGLAWLPPSSGFGCGCTSLPTGRLWPRRLPGGCGWSRLRGGCTFCVMFLPPSGRQPSLA